MKAGQVMCGSLCCSACERLTSRRRVSSADVLLRGLLGFKVRWVRRLALQIVVWVHREPAVEGRESANVGLLHGLQEVVVSVPGSGAQSTCIKRASDEASRCLQR
jgi:hypothetical protein